MAFSFESIKNFSSTAKAKWVCLGLFFAAAIFFTFKGCSSNNLFEKDYVIGQDGRWDGVALQGREKNLSAFNGDLLAKVGQLKEVQFHLVNGQIEELLKDLEAGRIQGILTSQKPTSISSNLYYFSNPYYQTGPVLVLPSTAPLRGWNEMRQKIIGVQARSPSIVELEKDPTVQVKLYDDILQVLADLSKRRIDGALLPAIPAHVYTSTFYSTELKVATLPLNADGIRLMALKNENGKELVTLFNQALNTIKEEGSYALFINRWGLVNVEKFTP